MAEAKEVQGRKKSTDKVDRTKHSMYCNVCPDVKATSFCEDCHEYMCTDCTSYHKRITATRNHILMTVGRFPSTLPPRRQDKQPFIEKCPDHQLEEIKFYCQKHKALCCVACNVSKHEHCSKSYIPDIAEEFKKGPEFKTLNIDIQDSDQLIVKSMADIDHCLKAVDALRADQIEKLRKYRAKIIEYLNKRERELQAEIQQICDKSTVLLRKLQTNLETCKSDIRSIRQKLKLHEQNSCGLYIAAKRALAQMIKLQSSLQEITQKIGYQRYSVMIDPKIQKIVEDHDGFADIELGIADLSPATLKRQPDVLLGHEKFDIVDMTAVSGDKILLTSYKEKKVLLVDSKTDTVLSEIVLQAKPQSICMVESQQAATTLNTKQIQFLKVKETRLTTDGVLDVDVDVRGIAAHKNNIVLSYSSPAGVKIISKKGKVIHTLNNTRAGRKVLKEPECIATASDDSIYVTDWRTNKITRLDSSLTILYTIAWPMLDDPCGIISMNRDQLLVCNYDNIVLIELSSSSMTVILDKQHGVERPCSICFCKEQNKLYVAPVVETFNIMVYKLL